MVRYVRFYTRWHRRENDQFSTLRCTKTGSTQPKLSAACFVVQSCLADADFVVFSNYCLIGTRQSLRFFFCNGKIHVSDGESGVTTMVGVSGSGSGVGAGSGCWGVSTGVSDGAGVSAGRSAGALPGAAAGA